MLPEAPAGKRPQKWAGAANLVGRFSSGGAWGALAGSYDSTSHQPRGSNRCNIFLPAGLTNQQRPNGAGQLFVVDCESDALAL